MHLGWLLRAIGWFILADGRRGPLLFVCCTIIVARFAGFPS